MNDTISRQEAIETAKELFDMGGCYCDKASIVGMLNSLPSTQPERKKGDWIVIAEFGDCRYVKCNQCKVTQVLYYNKPLTNFCPNCGADMRGENDG